MATIIFDIETGALPESELLASLPPFDASEVKVGNIKNPELIADKIKQAEEKHKSDYFERAALDAMTGRVLLIAWKHVGEDVLFFSNDNEAELLTAFWDYVSQHNDCDLIGFNVLKFDLPFLIKRSWKNGVRVPGWVRNGRYFSINIIDLRDAWLMGDYQGKGSLDSISKFLGLSGKNGDGKLFQQMWETNRDLALDYAANDVKLTESIAIKMGVITV